MFATAVGDATAGVASAVDAAAVGAAAAIAAACAVDAVLVVGASAAAAAAGLQTFPNGAAFVAGRRLKRSGCLGPGPVSFARVAAVALAAEAPSGAASGAESGRAASDGVANDRDGASVALAAAAVSSMGFLPCADQAGQHAVDDPGVDEARPAGSVQEVLEEDSGRLRIELLDS